MNSRGIWPAYDVILFDVGNTLLASRPSARFAAWADTLRVDAGAVETAWRRCHAAAEPLSPTASREEYKAFLEALFEKLIDAVGAECDRNSTMSALLDAWLSVGWEPFPEVASVLRDLRSRGTRLGVVSNWTVTLEDTLRYTGLAEHFEVISCSAVVGALKPDAAIFRHALEALGVPTALYVGDDYDVDVLGARAAGLDAVLIDRDGSSESAEPTIRTLDELREVLT